MGGQRQSSKGGGYVGGFLQLFDWNAKSRKKLFSNKTDIPDQSKQKKRSDGNLPVTRFNLAEMDVDEYLAPSSFRGSSEYSCASSVTDDEGFGSKAPNVVARLMGLDTMPASNLVEPYSTPFSDSQSLRESKYIHQKHQFRPENHSIYSNNSRIKVDAPIQKAEKIMNKPIEKFQSEILPPKSAKTIPITHHKLLSPIKSPGFISSNNAAHIMEAAARIIEPGPQASTSKTKMSSVGKSSVPFKVRELREKVEASHKPSQNPVESNSAKIRKGQPMNKSWNELSASEDRLGGNNKGKSISLAIQAKVNVQKREGQKEHSDTVLTHPNKSQSNSQKSMLKKTSNPNNNGALKQNNQKQNCPNDKEKLNLKSSVSNSQTRLKTSSGDSSLSRYKNSSKSSGNSKVGSRKLSPEANDSKDEVLYSNTKNIPRKRRSLDGNFNKDKIWFVDNMLVDEDDKPTQCNSTVDRQFSLVEESRKKGMDVVSFTFTSPLLRQNNVFGSDYTSKKAILNSDSRNNSKLSLMECDEIGADDLSLLLEQKLRELTNANESFKHGAGYSDPIFQDIAPTPQEVDSIMTMPHKKMNQDAVDMDMSNWNEGSNSTSTGGRELLTKYKLQGTMEMEQCRSDNTETSKSLHYRYPSPRSVLDLSFMAESWNSSETVHSINLEGSNTKQGSSVQALEVLGMNSYRNPHFMDLDTELTDSASSSSIKTLVKGENVAISMTSNMGSKWERHYISDILFNMELMFNEFTSGRACKIINPHLFDQLEYRNEALKENLNENKLERKLLFDCVSECVNLKCSKYTNAGFRTWEKGLSIMKRKERFAEDIYKEMLSWKGKDDSMVDDLVDKDMSNQYGKWLDFEIESFELGVEIEGQVLNSLINEVVKDLVIR